jgi:N-acetylneuraminic acid mutarotase
MKKTISLVLILLLGLVAVSLAEEYTWTQKTDMPTPRWKLDTCEVDGKIYAIGGVPTEGTGSRLSTVEEYDPTTDTWTRKADIPMARVSFSASVVSGRIYAIGGGGDGASITEEYDPITDLWTRKADMPTPRRFISSCVVNGKIYAIGGTPVGVWSGMKTVEEYDPVTDAWARKADMPTGVWGLCTEVVSGKIYALGGRTTAVARPYVQEYDPATDTWTRKSDMPVGTSNMGSVVLHDKIILIGGWLHSNAFPYTTVQVYDPEMDTWTIEGDAPFLRACFSADVLNNRIYAIGGTDRPHPCPATSTVYELTIIFPPDFNGDFKIDIEDLIILIEHWGQDEPSLDIAPTPSGDGIVDVQDLEVFMSYWGKELFDPTLIAYWMLDEAEGYIAYDSAGDYDGTLIGDPVWQPEGGMVGGALQLDGIDDYVSTDPVLNPADGKFSVVAWIKGVAPGQVVVSYQDVANWLAADTEGNLMTELKGPGRSAGLLRSETVITDGQWHRIGLVWDGTHRTLYVDSVVVADDEQNGLVGWYNGFYIGCGKSREPGSFFSGLIDDVRIYNRA